MPSLFFSKEILSFASQFPMMATTIFGWSSQLTSFASNLSPKAQANALKMIKSMYHLTIIAGQKCIQLYEIIMSKMGSKSVTDWEMPSGWILYPMASFILFIFPINFTINDPKESFKNKPLMFVNNRHVYGLEVIPLLALIYCKTGIWARVEAESYHFRIPLWAQIVQYFGAYERIETGSSTKLILELNQSVLVSPGGKVDTLSSPSYNINWPDGFISELETPLIVPVSVVGFNDMVSILTSIDFSPFLWIMGYKVESKSATIPIFFFQSFERVYVCFGPMKEYSEQETIDMVQQGLETVLETQAKDPDRILLKNIRQLLETGWSYMKPLILKVTPVLHNLSRKFYDWAVDALEKMD